MCAAEASKLLCLRRDSKRFVRYFYLVKISTTSTARVTRESCTIRHLYRSRRERVLNRLLYSVETLAKKKQNSVHLSIEVSIGWLMSV